MTTEIIDVAPHATAPGTALAAISAGPLAMAIQAMRAGMSIADMRGMLDLQKDWEANEARKAYVDAVAAFKLDPPTVYKDKENKCTNTLHYRSLFPSLVINDISTWLIAL